jgi:hypothetical protein
MPSGVWQKCRFNALQADLLLIKVWFFDLIFVVKNPPSPSANPFAAIL